MSLGLGILYLGIYYKVGGNVNIGRVYINSTSIHFAEIYQWSGYCEHT